MHYYTFHPKDYISKTHFLEPMEDLAYRRMLDYIYLNECHLPDDIDDIAKKINMRTHTDSIANVLQEFFDLTDDGYMNDRAEQEIAKYQEKSEKARKSAQARWKKKSSKPSRDKPLSDTDANALQTDCEGNANQEPLTINQEPLTTNKESSKSGVSEADLLVDFWNDNRPPSAAVKKEVWSKIVKTRLKTFSADEIKAAMLTVINSQWHQQNKQVLIKNAIDSDKRCAEAIEKSSQPQQSNNQVNRNEINQSANNSNQPKQSAADIYAANIARELAEYEAAH